MVKTQTSSLGLIALGVKQEIRKNVLRVKRDIPKGLKQLEICKRYWMFELKTQWQWQNGHDVH